MQERLDRAQQHLASQELTEAQAELEEARALAPDDAEVAFGLGDVAYRSLQMETAEGHYRHAAEMDPASSAAFANLALVLLELGLAQPAADAATRAIALDPREPRLKALLAQSLLRLGRPKEAADLLEQALASGLRGAEPQANLGRARDLLGQSDAALGAFEEALRQDPQLPLTHYWRAECLRRIGRTREADRERTAYRECQARMDRIVKVQTRLLQHPDDPRAWLELARLRVERGIPSQAVMAVLRAEQLAPKDAEVRRVHELVERAVAATPDVGSPSPRGSPHE